MSGFRLPYSITLVEDGSHRRGKVTSEHAEEARRLKAIWRQRQDELQRRGVGTQETFGAEYGIGNQAASGVTTPVTRVYAISPTTSEVTDAVAKVQ